MYLLSITFNSFLSYKIHYKWLNIYKKILFRTWAHTFSDLLDMIKIDKKKSNGSDNNICIRVSYHYNFCTTFIFIIVNVIIKYAGCVKICLGYWCYFLSRFFIVYVLQALDGVKKICNEFKWDTRAIYWWERETVVNFFMWCVLYNFYIWKFRIYFVM